MNTEYIFPEMDKNSYKPIYIQISDIIIDYAKKTGLKGGDLLPSENELLSRYNVSRNSIRLAVDRLVQMNFAVKQRGKGTFIKKSWPINLNPIMTIENSIKLTGEKLENKLISKTAILQSHVTWAKKLNEIKESNLVLIRRLKMASGKILALEERLLPERVCDRYEDEELAKDNICPDLLDRFPDTSFRQLAYHFISEPLNKDEQKLLERKPQVYVLQRLGEYFDASGTCFMNSRYVFASELVDVCYKFERNENSLIVTE